MLLAILNAVLKIISIVSGVDTLVNIINGNTQSAAQETTKFLIQTNTNTTVNDLNDGTFGLAKLASNDTAILAAIASARTAILTAVGTPQQAGSAVTLPPTQPSGYGPSNAADVWNFQVFSGSPRPFSAAEAQVNAWFMAHNWGSTWKYDFSDAPFMQLIGAGEVQDLTPFLGSSPRPRISTVRPSDTVLSWLNREASFFTWNVGVGGQVYALDNRLAVGVTWVCRFTDEELHLAAFGTVAPSANAPIWPGLAGVTLGTPVAITPSLVVTGPMQGVIIDITATAPRQQYGSFGTLQGLRFTGALTFVDDNGKSERPQSLGSVHEVLLPKSMAVAASCAFKADAAVVGTVTPFTIP